MAPAPDILIVEDDATTRNLLAELLSDEGYAVRVCATAHEALTAFQERLPALLLLDLQLPDMLGTALLSDLRAWGPAHVPTIMMTARSNASQDGVEGVYAWVAKPFDLDALLDLVGDSMRTAPLAASSLSQDGSSSQVVGCAPAGLTATRVSLPMYRRAKVDVPHRWRGRPAYRQRVARASALQCATVPAVPAAGADMPMIPMLPDAFVELRARVRSLVQAAHETLVQAGNLHQRAVTQNAQAQQLYAKAKAHHEHFQQIQQRRNTQTMP